MLKVDQFLMNPILKRVVASFVEKMQGEGDPLKRMFSFMQRKRKPTRGMGLLYFMLMDLYIENIDSILYESIQQFELKCFWSRCLNMVFLGFPTEKDAINALDVFQLDI